MRRRQGYTLVELLVAMALILLIMSILSTAYVAGLDTFTKLKGLGDMAEQLRMATTILRRDLAADHFTGAGRLSDPSFVTNPPREGYFVASNAASFAEGGVLDMYNNPSPVSVQSALRMTVKLRGNRMEDFFAVPLAPDSPAFTFFGQPQDAYYGGYQWGEVAYFLLPQGQTTTGPAGTQKPLFALYRAQLAVMANSPGPGNPALVNLISISPATGNFNTPSALVNPANRPAINTASLLLSDVLNFDVQVLPAAGASFLPSPGLVMNYDTANSVLMINNQPAATTGLYAVQIILRVYDIKTRQARQITVIQDL